MTLTVAPTQSTTQATLRSLLVSILPPAVEVVQGQDNRVPEPVGSDFVVITPMARTRLSTNVDTYADVQFTGSISGATLNVTLVQFGTISVGSTLFGVGVASGTTIAAQGTGSGGVGTYTVSVPQTLAPATLSAGNELLQQATQVEYQIDVHGPNSADNAQIISTMFRDEYATNWWLAAGVTTSAPLYADDPRQVPFTNENQQVEYRWVITARLEADQTIVVPMQVAQALSVNIIDVP